MHILGTLLFQYCSPRGGKNIIALIFCPVNIHKRVPTDPFHVIYKIICCLHIFSIKYKKQTSLFIVFQIREFWFGITGHKESSLDLKKPLQALSNPTFPILSHLKYMTMKAKFNQKDHIWNDSLLYEFSCNCPNPSVYHYVNCSVATTTRVNVLEKQHHMVLSSNLCSWFHSCLPN